MNNGEAIIRALEREGVKYLFGIPGGNIMPAYDALVTTRTSMKLILTRHEQGASHMADGYARATGKPGVVLVTSGPGATNVLTGLMTAHMDSVPMVVITGQQVRSMLGKDAFQEADIFGMAMPAVKHSYLVKNGADLNRVIREAFYIASSGRPGPVLLDIPKDVSTECSGDGSDVEMDLPGYVPKAIPDQSSILNIAEALSRSRRPVLLVGHGALISGASAQIRTLAEIMHVPVMTTFLGKGAFPETHALSLGWPGMHGTVYANRALCECDLVLSIGCRFDDRILGRPEQFCRNAVKIHVDIDPAEIGKMIQPDLFCVGDAKEVVEALMPHVGRLNTAGWVAHLAEYRKAFPLKYRKTGGLKMQHIIDELWRMTNGRAIVVTDVGQHQMWAGQFYHTDYPDTWISSGGAGTMGFGVPAAIGAQFGRPNDLVLSISGDGGFQMMFQELAIAVIHHLPIKFFVMNNHYLGMVRQLQELFCEDRRSGVDLEGSPDFTVIARAYGMKGFHLRRPGDVKRILKQALAYHEGPCLVNAEVEKTENVFPFVPGGKSLEEMIVE